MANNSIFRLCLALVFFTFFLTSNLHALSIKVEKEYREVKNTYVKALIDGDKEKQITSLKNIIKFSKQHKIQSSKYKDKLKLLEVKKEPKKPIKVQTKQIKKVEKQAIKIIKKTPTKLPKLKKIETKKSTKINIMDYDVDNFRNKIIVIDAGHGGKDPGAIVGTKYEKNIVLPVAKKLYTILKLRGYKVFMTRQNDKFVDLKQRTKFARNKKADIFLSLHVNAAPKGKEKHSKGVETYFLSQARSDRAKEVAKTENSSALKYADEFASNSFLNSLNQEKIITSNKLAIDIQKGMMSKLNGRQKAQDRGVREAPFWVLVGVQIPSVLIELGYITHPIEGKRLFSKKYQHTLANGIADGIDSFFIKN